MAFLTIPGNIKQASLPFQLDPSMSYQDAKKGYKEDFGVFTFSPVRANKSDGLGLCSSSKKALITTFPDSLKSYINEDISFKHLYNRDPQSKVNRITYDEFTRELPYVQFREYLCDSKVDQIFNFFNGFLSGFRSAENNTSDSGNQDESAVISKMISSLKAGVSGFGSTITNVVKAIWDMFADTDKSEVWKVFNGLEGDLEFLTLKNKENKYVTLFPYMMYYMMVGTTTTNIYEVPFNPSELYKTGGSEGWKQDKFNFGMGDPKSMIGSVVGNILKNVGIHMSPTWSGNSEQVDDLTISFQLFNGTNAINNFIMVNTLVPNNMWCQYHIYRHCSDLYDIKVGGIKRMMMCSADITVTPKGVLRVPPKSFYRTIKDKYLQKSLWKQGFLDENEASIRIPDVYEITIKFTSLLPNNFNNFLFNYARGAEIFSDISKGIYGHRDSIHTEFVTALSKDLKTVQENIQKEQKQKATQAEIEQNAQDAAASIDEADEINNREEEAKKTDEKLAADLAEDAYASMKADSDKMMKEFL